MFWMFWSTETGTKETCHRVIGCIAAEVRWARVITEKIYNHSVHSCVCNSEMCVRVKSQGVKKLENQETADG